jgi:hypothetical protein
MYNNATLGLKAISNLVCFHTEIKFLADCLQSCVNALIPLRSGRRDIPIET